MYVNFGKLRWYQGPVHLNEILSFTVLVKENCRNVAAMSRSHNLQTIDGKLNLSDWCVGVMEGFLILEKVESTKSLRLLEKGQVLYENIIKDQQLYSFLRRIIGEKLVGHLSEEKTKKVLKSSPNTYECLRSIVQESEQFQNVMTFLLENGTLSLEEFKSGFYSEMLFLYNGEIPVEESKTASTADNRIPFTYQIGAFFNIVNVSGHYISLSSSVRSTEITKKGVHRTTEVDEEIIDQIDQVRITRSVAIIDSSDINEFNNRLPQKLDKPIGGKQRYKTNPRVSKTALKDANYECEYGLINNEDHITFSSKFGYNYVEAHHLIPMQAQDDFPNLNLDRTQNIVSLCPICHSAIHYGSKETREDIIKKLYHNKVIELRKISKEFAMGAQTLLEKYYK